ncbi:MAG TPA: bifunctional transaldolase/phosoglucose isomerase [Vicinamibacterales bacterium]
MNPGPLQRLGEIGQSVWRVGFRRRLLTSGLLARGMTEDNIRGVILDAGSLGRVMAGSGDYDELLRDLSRRRPPEGAAARAIFVDDARAVAQVLLPTYEQLEGRDGFVTVDVDPSAALETVALLADARALWQAIDRPNAMIAVPATPAGIPAIRDLLAAGINVYASRIGTLARYHDVLEAWTTALEARAAAGRPLQGVASVAGFSLQLIDAQIDPFLDRLIAGGGSTADRAVYVRGQAGIATARLAYQAHKEASVSPRLLELLARGAQPQRLLWREMRARHADEVDVRYVDALVAPETVAALDDSVVQAYREHGHPAVRIEEDLGGARRTLDQLKEFGLDVDRIAAEAEADRIRAEQARIRRLDAAAAARTEISEAYMDSQQMDLGGAAAAAADRVKALAADDFGVRLWRKDASLWTADRKGQAVIANALGWLRVVDAMHDALGELEAFRRDVHAAGIRHVVHMGMGGSSLAPLVFQRTLREGADGLPLTVLDTTDPATVLAIERALPLEHTLFIVASKSGTTAEPNAFGEYFFDKVHRRVGDRAGAQFVAITDPGTPLVALAAQRQFRRTFLNFADIGGRYSALSYFGLVPAVLMGADVAGLIDRARVMEAACAAAVPAPENPGVRLGAALGELASRGRDKVTFLMPSSIDTLGMWLEQLIAESTGKEGRGLLPVAGETPGEPSVYGHDRVFVQIKLAGERDGALDAATARLRDAGQPLITITMQDRLELAQEFYRWEIATATAGAVIGINPFDQPNVQESKDNTNRLLAAVREKGALPDEAPVLSDGALRFYGKVNGSSSQAILKELLAGASDGHYVAMQAYLTESPETDRALQAIRLRIRDARRVATTVGYGPRFLHSTGQFHKGGPNTGMFLQLTADDREDAALPGEPYGFSVFKAAQALGDFQALQQHGRRALRVHLGGDVSKGLARLEEMIKVALEG